MSERIAAGGLRRAVARLGIVIDHVLPAPAAARGRAGGSVVYASSIPAR